MVRLFGPGNSQTVGFWLGHRVFSHISIYPSISIDDYAVLARGRRSRSIPHPESRIKKRGGIQSLFIEALSNVRSSLRQRSRSGGYNDRPALSHRQICLPRITHVGAETGTSTPHRASPEPLARSCKGAVGAATDTPYRPEGWTVRQVVHHVPDSHLHAYIRTKLALTEDEPTIKPYDEDRWARLADTPATPVEVHLRYWIRCMIAGCVCAFAPTRRLEANVSPSRTRPYEPGKESGAVRVARTPSRGSHHEPAREERLVGNSFWFPVSSFQFLVPASIVAACSSKLETRNQKLSSRVTDSRNFGHLFPL